MQIAQPQDVEMSSAKSVAEVKDKGAGLDPGSAMSHDGDSDSSDIVIMDSPEPNVKYTSRVEQSETATAEDGASLDAKALLKAALLSSAMSKKRKGVKYVLIYSQ